MFRYACKGNNGGVVYFDSYGNKYVASGGHFPWRIQNPGLVHSRSRHARKNGSIGTCEGYAVFLSPLHGHQALCDWLRSKKIANGTLRTIGSYYSKGEPDAFAIELSSVAKVPFDKKICQLDSLEFQRLLIGIEKSCGYICKGDESLTLLSKISAKFHNVDTGEKFYLVKSRGLITKSEAIEQASSDQLDAVVVHKGDCEIYLRSRPSFSMQHNSLSKKVVEKLPLNETLVARKVGEKRVGQCIWGFINGVWNTKGDSLESARLISKKAGNEQILSFPNDTQGYITDFFNCYDVKKNYDHSIARRAVKFFQFLIAESANDPYHPPIVIFAHSMGAIIASRAIELMKPGERRKLRVFTFGGGSYVLPDRSHPDSQNYASWRDLIPYAALPLFRAMITSYNYGRDEGLNDEQIKMRWVEEDVLLYLDTYNVNAINKFKKDRMKIYDKFYPSIKNIILLENESFIEHLFSIEPYQKAIQTVIQKYKRSGSDVEIH